MNALTQRTPRRRARRAYTMMALLLIAIIAAFLISMNTGTIRLTPGQVIGTLFGQGTDMQDMILFQFRLPRIVISILVGAGLALSGAILQGLSRNTLADPGILGINAGAGLVVVLYVSYFSAIGGKSSVYMMPILAMAGAVITAAIIYFLSYQKGKGIAPIRLILVGIAVAAGISAVMVILTIRLDPNQYQSISIWLAGSIWGTNWKFVLALLPWLIVFIPYVLFKANTLNVLSLGDSIAKGLGTRIERERLGLLAASVALAGACVAVGGGIGFIGLIGPHVARRLVGAKHQYMLPTTMLTGGLLLIVADTLARWIMQPTEIPTGIIVAIIGAPYFIYLFIKS